MSQIRQLTARVLATADVFDPRAPLLSIGRSLLGLAQLCVLLFSPDRVLFAQAPALVYGRGCDGVRGLSLWCITSHDASAVRIDKIVAAGILAVVVSGYRPRWFCIPHWYIAFSLATSLISPDGGEQVAQIAALLLIPLLLGDERRWHWRTPEQPLAPRWRGASYAAHLALRCQGAIIYLVAAGSKTATTAWRRGVALRVIFQDPSFGITPPLFRTLHAVFDSYPVSALAGWATIAVETTIALSVIGPPRGRRVGLVLTVILHSMIIVLMGLFSFGLTMIGTVAAATIVPPEASEPRNSRLIDNRLENEERQHARRDPALRSL